MCSIQEMILKKIVIGISSITSGNKLVADSIEKRKKKESSIKCTHRQESVETKKKSNRNRHKCHHTENHSRVVTAGFCCYSISNVRQSDLWQ